MAEETKIKSARVGIKVKGCLWDRMKHLAIKKRDAAGTLADAAFELYLDQEEAK